MEPFLRKSHPSPKHLIFDSTSGATLSSITNKAINILSRANNPENYHIYIIGGYCDLSKRVRHTLHNLSRNRHPAIYEEFIFQETPEEAVTRLSSIIEESSNRITSTGATPIFCTIAPSSLETWNNKRLSQKKTAHLCYTNEYPAMQANLIEAIIQIN